MMNFVDVQPKSFLDYAWTSPSPAAMGTVKPTKTTRKQNRCCDQCRKGKRACDAAILEDTLLEGSSSGNSPIVFHYSDVFGPLSACSNCEKTKKTCTFEWLRSQRLTQVIQPPVKSPAPPPKRRRTQSHSTTASPPEQDSSRPGPATASNVQPSPKTAVPDHGAAQLGHVFADFATAFDTDSINFYHDIPTGLTSGTADSHRIDFDDLNRSPDIEQPYLLGNSGANSSADPSESINESVEKDSLRSLYDQSTDASRSSSHKTLGRIPGRRKRRRRSPNAMSNAALSPSNSLAADLVSSTNNVYLTEGLLRIYDKSFENALSCWMTEKTCPSSAVAEAIQRSAIASPNWTRIYHRVFRLDRVARSLRGRRLTITEDRAASRALNTAVYAFAAQTGPRSTTKYPFNGDNNGFNAFRSGGDENFSGVEFSRKLQVSAWHEARKALQDVGEAESFRVVLAQIVFALTQKPFEDDKHNNETPSHEQQNASETPRHSELEGEHDTRDEDVDECEDLMSKLDLAMDVEGPPVHLEKGLRLIHSLRSKMAISAANPKRKDLSSRANIKKPWQPSRNHLEPEDRATVDLLFWLGVMFDTLSAAMHKRPLVVSDEDSNIALNEGRSGKGHEQRIMEAGADRKKTCWDDLLFTNQHEGLQHPLTRWPCSFDQAASLLCEAAPIKVLLFRRVTRIQTLLARCLQGETVEKALEKAFAVCNHWDKSFAPFIEDCIRNHNRLPPRIQSWYICLVGHWHLATLLLGDLIEIIDESELGLPQAMHERQLVACLAKFRERNCRTISALAQCAVPNNDPSLHQPGKLNFSMDGNALLLEPWTAVLVRAFAKAGVLLIEFDTMLPLGIIPEEAFERADHCVHALRYLGRKSDIALAAARVLEDALKERRYNAPERVDAVTAFLEGGGWHEFEGFDDPFGLNGGAFR